MHDDEVIVIVISTIFILLCCECELTENYIQFYCLYVWYRSSRTEPPDLAGIMRVTDDMIDSLVCPPPPTEPPVMSEEMINELIVPAPGWSKCFVSTFFCSAAIAGFCACFLLFVS